MDLPKSLPGVTCLANVPMREHTTFRIGGPARWLVQPETAEEAGEILAFCKKNAVRPFFLGNGSNLLVADEGYDGLVLSTAKLDCIVSISGSYDLYADSGVPLPKLANFAAQQGLTGLEWAAGIPGSVGGAVRMNAGAYGGEMAQVVARVDYLDETGELWVLEPVACEFAYRHSVFCGEPWLITGAMFRLQPGDPADIRARMAELGRRRREKQPLEYPSAGSTFKRPQGHYAAALIDGCGLRGLRVGDAQVSEKHAGFVVNRGSATAAEVLELMDQVKRRVYDQTGVTLEPEVEILR